MFKGKEKRLIPVGTLDPWYSYNSIDASLAVCIVIRYAAIIIYFSLVQGRTKFLHKIVSTSKYFEVGFIVIPRLRYFVFDVSMVI